MFFWGHSNSIWVMSYVSIKHLTSHLPKGKLPQLRAGSIWLTPGCGHLEKGMATHSSILAWRIPWIEEPGRLQSIESDWVTNTNTQPMTERVWSPCYRMKGTLQEARQPSSAGARKGTQGPLLQSTALFTALWKRFLKRRSSLQMLCLPCSI